MGVSLGRKLLRQPEPRSGLYLLCFAQFLIHDLTYELVRRLSTDHAPRTVTSGPSSLRLQTLYGSGPEIAPHLYAFYDQEFFSGRFLDSPAGTKQDLPRNRQGRALIADPRNAENVVLAQLHLGMIRFHNKVVQLVAGTGDRGSALFEEAQRQVQWHYQWAIVNDFLPKLVGPSITKAALEREFPRHNAPTGLPLEVAQGVLRYVYSQVRLKYRINDEATVSFLPAEDTSDTLLHHRSQTIPSRLAVDWEHFFDIGDTSPQSSKLIDTKITPAFLNLPFINDPRPARRSVAVRFFLQGKRAGLPSGEAMARTLGKSPTRSNPSALRALGLTATPLLYYVLAEAEPVSGLRKRSTRPRRGASAGGHADPMPAVGSAIIPQCAPKLSPGLRIHDRGGAVRNRAIRGSGRLVNRGLEDGSISRRIHSTEGSITVAPAPETIATRDFLASRGSGDARQEPSDSAHCVPAPAGDVDAKWCPPSTSLHEHSSLRWEMARATGTER